MKTKKFLQVVILPKTEQKDFQLCIEFWENDIVVFAELLNKEFKTRKQAEKSLIKILKESFN